MQRGESHPHLRLDAGDPNHGEIAGARNGIVEECRLPDARVAAEHECAGAAGAGRVENAIDRRPFRAATEKHAATVASRGPSRARRRRRRRDIRGDYTFSGIRVPPRWPSFMLSR